MKAKKEEYWPLTDDCGGAPDGDPWRVLLFVLAAATLAALGLSLAGCSRVHYVTVPSASHVRDSVSITDSVVFRYQTHLQDSVRIKDSTVIVQDAAGNTLMKEHYRQTERYRSLEDAYAELLRQYESLRAERRDTVAVPYPVERRLTRWEQARMDFGGAAMAASAIAAVSFIIVWLVRKRAGK